MPASTEVISESRDVPQRKDYSGDGKHDEEPGSNKTLRNKYETMEEAYARDAPAAKVPVIPHAAPSDIDEIDVQLSRNADGHAGSVGEPTKSQVPLEPNLGDWEQALVEFSGEGRMLGLWAKLYADNNGNESATKVQYLKIRAFEIYRQNPQATTK